MRSLQILELAEEQILVVQQVLVLAVQRLLVVQQVLVLLAPLQVAVARIITVMTLHLELLSLMMQDQLKLRQAMRLQLNKMQMLQKSFLILLSQVSQNLDQLQWLA